MATAPEDAQINVCAVSGAQIASIAASPLDTILEVKRRTSNAMDVQMNCIRFIRHNAILDDADTVASAGLLEEGRLQCIVLPGQKYYNKWPGSQDGERTEMGLYLLPEGKVEMYRSFIQEVNNRGDERHTLSMFWGGWSEKENLISAYFDDKEEKVYDESSICSLRRESGRQTMQRRTFSLHRDDAGILHGAECPLYPSEGLDVFDEWHDEGSPVAPS
eukprot:TRINITY_DN13601_c0_g1_i1.p1 TRINITY_DN13601_c0_g1~~TRINITY_DN13601_c0_g1_i1.p1  ORF type:complete len:218 (+),score=33.59 TRINITY_DN13601_c0_g1_i1:49-702(+)